MHRVIAGIPLLAALITSCVPVQRPFAESVELLLVPALIAAPAGLSPVRPAESYSARVPLTVNSLTALELLRMDVPSDGSWITARATIPRDSFPYSTRVGVLTFGGPAREPAAVLRVLHADTSWRRVATNDLRRAIAAGGVRALVIVPGAVAPREADALFSTSSELAAAARAGGALEILFAVAGADTAAYPSRPLAAVADGLLIGIDPPASAPAPGPPVTTGEMRRIIGLRASEVGRARLVLLLPVHGYLWLRDSVARPISFEDGVRMAAEWRVPLLRDGATDALYARAPSRGELWLIDGQVVARLVREARVMGIRRFAAVLGSGEDPALADSLAASLQTTGSSR